MSENEEKIEERPMMMEKQYIMIYKNEVNRCQKVSV